MTYVKINIANAILVDVKIAIAMKL